MHLSKLIRFPTKVTLTEMFCKEVLTGYSESTLKVYAGIDEDTQEAILEYRNQAKYPDEEIRVKQLIVQGVAKHVIKAL